MGERQQPHGRDRGGAIPGAPISRHAGNPRRARDGPRADTAFFQEGGARPEKEKHPRPDPRQLEVLQLLSEGKSVKEIGKELFLSEATVRNHVRSLLQALGAHSQLEVLAKAREMGILGG